MLSYQTLVVSVLVALPALDGALALPISTRAAAAAAAGDFGSCTAPQIQFATGLDNRKETAFAPVDQSKFYV